MNKHYDYLLVGAGLFNATVAYFLKRKGYKVFVIEKRDHIGGNIYTKKEHNIDVHVYGAHIFHTDNKDVWEFVNKLTPFNVYNHRVMANYKGTYYSLPFNLKTFKTIYGTDDLEIIQNNIEQEKKEFFKNKEYVDNLENHIINQVGTSVYTRLIKGYTEKQWNADCKDLPSSIIKRLPIRFNDNDSYFNDIYQGMPKYGYTALIEALLEGIEVKTSTDFFGNKEEYLRLADKIIYSGSIDKLLDNKYGPLSYRSLRFETEIIKEKKLQPLPVINYTEREVPYTRIIEHANFLDQNQEGFSIITKEYPDDYNEKNEPYYPLGDKDSIEQYNKYKKEIEETYPQIIFGGRLGLYKYFDMDDTIIEAMTLVEKL